MSKIASILVVDDEPNNFDVIETLLLDEDYQLNYAASGLKAMSRLDVTQPDVILLDVMMPDMDGIEVCRQIKANPQWCHVPIIMVTALTAKEDLARCMEAGANDFISKPINGVELRARTRSMLRNKQQYDLLKSVAQLREDLSYMLVHDLRGPITSVIMSSQVLLHRSSLAEGELKQVRQIHDSILRLNRMTDDLLMLAKMEAGRLFLNRTEIDLSSLMVQILPELKELSQMKQIQLEVDLPSLRRWICVDINLLNRLIHNLISNAVKFSPPHTTIWLRVEYPQTAASYQTRIQVIDQGAGIREELRQRIFDKFEIGEVMHGTSQIGLGLTFCKMVVEAHDGRISVEPNHPQGSIFTVEL